MFTTLFLQSYLNKNIVSFLSLHSHEHHSTGFPFDTVDIDSPLIIGYALCFYTYSTWEGKSLFMEDIYVKSSHRTHGVGKQMFTHVVQHAQKTNCSRLDFHVLDWNPACKFYEKMSSVNLTAKEGWQLYRLHQENFGEFLN